MREAQGPACQASRSPVSRTTELKEGWPSDTQAAKAARLTPKAPSTGTRQMELRSVTGSCSTRNSAALANSMAAVAQLMTVSSTSRPLSRSNAPSATISTIAVCHARRRRLSR